MTAAIHLFSRSGYHGTTTKEVSKLANVSESNIFRYYPTKRDLFLSAIEHALTKVTGRGDALVRVLNASDAQSALLSVFELISETVAQHPELVRLLHFSALEFEPDMEPLFLQHVRPYVACLTNSIRRWSHGSQLAEMDQKLTVLSFIATVMLLQDLFPALVGSTSPFANVENTASAYAELWSRVLAKSPEAQLQF